MTDLKSKNKSVKLILFLSVILISALISLQACNSNDVNSEPSPEDTVVVLNPSEVDASKIYIPQELKTNDFYRSSSAWYYGRSKQSEHFIVFWASGYKDKDPNSTEVPGEYRVDIDDLLEKAEQFYEINIEELKFAETGVGKSKLDQYKMMIFIYYQTEWLATGSGYDNTIGALWVSPSTCHPVGSTIGHEIGHSFQYQVFCDLGGTTGFRYGFGGNGGNGFWEQTAQWQSFQSYPDEAFTSYNFSVYTENYHRHVIHEWYRYASYFIHYYWVDKHGRDIIGKVWREAQSPEDPLQAYMRITGISDDQLNAEIYDAASKLVTWDLDAIREKGSDYIGAQTFKSSKLEDESYQVSYDRCPGTTGYNVIRLNVPAAGTEVSTAFTGLVNAVGYNQVNDPGRAGWRYGYVALLENGTRVYGDMHSGTTGTANFIVPANCSKLWLVVTGAPNTYAAHPWDENEANDDQWPYKVKFTNTALYGDIKFDGTEVPSDLTLTYNVKFPFSSSAYPGTNVVVSSDDMVKMAKAFVLQPSEISSAIGTTVKFYAVESNGTLNATTTATGLGHWFDSSGNVIAWGTTAMVFSEFANSNWTFALGQYPSHCTPGTTYTVKQALVYEYEPGKKVQTTFVFNITIE
jgi:plastocyanin